MQTLSIGEPSRESVTVPEIVSTAALAGALERPMRDAAIASDAAADVMRRNKMGALPFLGVLLV
jgi:hypothetical protein